MARQGFCECASLARIEPKLAQAYDEAQASEISVPVLPVSVWASTRLQHPVELSSHDAAKTGMFDEPARPGRTAWGWHGSRT